MSESTSTTERDAHLFPVDSLPSPRPAGPARTPSPAPVVPTPSPLLPAGEQEHHPVTTILAPEAAVAPRVARLDPRPVSAPTHRADAAADVVPTDPAEPRPASVARHSVDTSAITLPVFAPEVDPSLPQPPERVTLDDDVLVRMVERRLDDTATVDLMAVVQAQLQARRVEAARFASWAREMDRVGTDEAADALERTRLRFTGVIDVVLPLDLDLDRDLDDDDSPASAPSSDREARVAPPARVPAALVEPPAPEDGVLADAVSRPVPVQADGTAVESTARAETTDAVPGAPVRPVASESAPGPREAPAAGRLPRRLVLAGLAVALLVVLAAVVLTLVDSALLVSAVLATVAVPVAGGLGGAAALSAVAHRPADLERVASRGPAAVVAGVVVAAVLGYGVLVTTASSLAWQGWLVRLVGFTGMTPEVAVVAALLVAAVAAFVVAVLATGLRSSSRR
ncbi:hypothetical protein [Frigoribacterium faeni]|uniref:hypothetical protein n=1 Tax=Frigoribacterium faeni TaxID=145483 RepID=UPI00141B1B8C|nr:hypothetical protein [Frigoribacterium faeni]NIJ03778.1 hypothetical protein [Frigoribacterium faeni]